MICIDTRHDTTRHDTIRYDTTLRTHSTAQHSIWKNTVSHRTRPSSGCDCTSCILRGGHARASRLGRGEWWFRSQRLAFCALGLCALCCVLLCFVCACLCVLCLCLCCVVRTLYFFALCCCLCSLFPLLCCAVPASEHPSSASSSITTSALLSYAQSDTSRGDANKDTTHEE